MVEGTEIVYGYRYFFYKDGTASRNSDTIVPEDINDNSYLLKNLKEDTDLQRFVAYADGVLMYRTRTENDFLDLSGLEGLPLMLVLSTI